jgi:hypothetical protein
MLLCTFCVGRSNHLGMCKDTHVGFYSMFLLKWLLLEIRWNMEGVLVWGSLLPSHSNFLQSEINSYHSFVTVLPANKGGEKWSGIFTYLSIMCYNLNLSLPQVSHSNITEYTEHIMKLLFHFFQIFCYFTFLQYKYSHFGTLMYSAKLNKRKQTSEGIRAATA